MGNGVRLKVGLTMVILVIIIGAVVMWLVPGSADRVLVLAIVPVVLPVIYWAFPKR